MTARGEMSVALPRCPYGQLLLSGWHSWRRGRGSSRGSGRMSHGQRLLLLLRRRWWQGCSSSVHVRVLQGHDASMTSLVSTIYVLLLLLLQWLRCPEFRL